MRIFTLAFVLVLFVVPSFAADFKTGQELIAAMHKKYDGKWYKTLTFVQKTTNFKPDGTFETSTWYEAMKTPGKLRIDFEPLEKGGGILFADGKLFSYRDGKLAGSRDFIHPLLAFGFDIYCQSVATTLDQIKGLNIDMSIVRQDTWQGKKVYVVGAKEGDLKSPQVWVNKKNLYFVRLFELAGKDKKSIHETQFNKYVKAGGGWVAPEVLFFVDGVKVTSEEYTDIQPDVKLEDRLWNPDSWLTADRTYFKKK